MSAKDRTGEVWEASLLNGSLRLLYLVVGPGANGSQRVVCLEADGLPEDLVPDRALEEGREGTIIRWRRFE